MLSGLLEPSSAWLMSNLSNPNMIFVPWPQVASDVTTSSVKTHKNSDYFWQLHFSDFFSPFHQFSMITTFILPFSIGPFLCSIILRYIIFIFDFPIHIMEAKFKMHFSAIFRLTLLFEQCKVFRRRTPSQMSILSPQGRPYLIFKTYYIEFSNYTRVIIRDTL